MIRKWMTILLALLLAVMLPVCAMAETLQHTLTIVPGDMLASEPAIADLLDVLSIIVTPGEKSGALTLTLGDKDIATVAVGADPSALYMYSNEFLGETVISANWDQVFELIKLMIQAEMIDENGGGPGVDSIMAQIDQYKAQLMLMLENGVQVNTGVTLSKEEAMAQMNEMLGDYPEMIAWTEGIYDEMAAQDGEFTAENRDTADQKYSLTLDNADFLALMDTDYVYRTISDQIVAQDASIDGDSLVAMTDQAIAEARAAFEQMTITVTTDVYTLDEGKTLVGFDMNMDFVSQEDQEDQVKMIMNYDRHTTEAGVSHKGDVWMGPNDEEAIEMKLDALCGADGVCKGIVGLLADGEEVVVQFGSEEKAENVTERFASLYLRSEASAILEPAASSRPLITFNVVSSPAQNAAVEKIDTVDYAATSDIMQMNSEEMEAFMTDISGRAMQVLFTAMSALPTSTLSMFMGEM